MKKPSQYEGLKNYGFLSFLLKSQFLRIVKGLLQF